MSADYFLSLIHIWNYVIVNNLPIADFIGSPVAVAYKRAVPQPVREGCDQKMMLIDCQHGITLGKLSLIHIISGHLYDSDCYYK